MTVLRPKRIATSRVAYRTWRVFGGMLRTEASWHHHVTAWFDGTATADRRPSFDDHRGQQHGLHAWLSLGDGHMAPWRSDRVKGAIVVWGRVIIHERGLRAEHAKVIAFLDEHQPCLPALSERYGVPVLPEAELRAYAGWWGE